MTALSARMDEDALDEVCRRNGWEWGMTLATGTDCAWSADIRVTPRPNDPAGADRSHVVHATGGATAEAALGAAWEAIAGWSEQWAATIHEADADRCPGSGEHWATDRRKGSPAVCPACRRTPAGLGVPRPRRLVPSGFDGRVPAHRRRP